MLPAETHQIADALKLIAEKMQPQPYTLTGASDWPMLLAIGGMLGVAIWGMYRNILSAIAGNKEDSNKGLDLLWDEARDIRKVIHEEMKECKEKCCDQ